MPIYEFFCESCNTLFKFFSKTVNTEKIPDCPKCPDKKLQRHVSTFATLSPRSADDAADDNMPDIDESKMEQAMSMLAREADSIDEEDPRQAAALMRKLSETTGLQMGAGMEEALSRLERGEDPDQIEADLGDVLENEEPFSLDDKGKSGRKKTKPDIDETIYDL